MELKQFNTYKELVNAPSNEETRKEKYQMLLELYNTSYKNEIWIGLILDFLNDNNEGKCYNEYYLNPEGSYGTRKHTYRFISTEEDMPCSISDDEVGVLRRLNAHPKFILYDYKEKTSSDVFAYLEYERNLVDCLNSIGMTEDLKDYLCEYCFQKLKREICNQTSQEQTCLKLTKK